MEKNYNCLKYPKGHLLLTPYFFYGLLAPLQLNQSSLKEEMDLNVLYFREKAIIVYKVNLKAISKF